MDNKIWEEIVAKYESRTKISKKHSELAVSSLPGGDTRWATFYNPYPTYMEKGKGAKLIDVDGNEYIDLQNNYTSLIHGHSHPEIVKAAKEAIEKDIILGAPVESQYKLANLIVDRFPGIDQIRFVNSGTEATMMAMRAARAYTGKEIIIKTDGAYHGSHDLAQINTKPDMSGAPMPIPKPSKPGVPKCGLDAVKVGRFNDLASIEILLKQYDGEVAGVIIEPVMNTAGMIPATLEFMKGLRELCDQYKVLLIFDEIVTFRLNTGGIQKMYNIIPDITALGKSIGGGFAIGAFGAKQEIMDIFHPVSGEYFHSGTFNGHPVAMSAGIKAVELLDENAINHINRLGEKLEVGIKGAFDNAGMYGFATRSGSLLYIHWSKNPIIDAKDVVSWKEKAGDLPKYLHLELMNRGIHAANRGLMNISTAMTDEDVNVAIKTLTEVLLYLKPHVQTDYAHLLK